MKVIIHQNHQNQINIENIYGQLKQFDLEIQMVLHSRYYISKVRWLHNAGFKKAPDKISLYLTRLKMTSIVCWAFGQLYMNFIDALLVSFLITYPVKKNHAAMFLIVQPSYLDLWFKLKNLL